MHEQFAIPFFILPARLFRGELAPFSLLSRFTKIEKRSLENMLLGMLLYIKKKGLI